MYQISGLSVKNCDRELPDIHTYIHTDGRTDGHTYRGPKQGKPGRNRNSSQGSVLVSGHYWFVKQCWLVYITGLYRVQVSEKYRFNFDNVPTFCKEITKQGYLKVGLFRLRAGSYIWTCPYLKMGISFFRQSETGGHSPKKNCPVMWILRISPQLPFFHSISKIKMTSILIVGELSEGSTPKKWHYL